MQTLADGRYVFEERLGAGGMATVWRVWDSRLEVWRAVKVLHPEVADGGSARERFDREARAMARLQHPRIVAVHDVGEDDGSPYLVMELAPGGSVADLVARDGPLPPGQACQVALDVLEALAVAHAAGVVHRDVKPHNVLVSAEGRAMVSDFGIARVMTVDSGLTRTGATMGTLAYMAPEQRSDAARVDGRADVYAAAGTLYHLLTGREPLDLYVERPGAFDGVPEALVAPIRQAVAYLPDDRPDAAALAAQLAAILPGLGPAPPLPIDRPVDHATPPGVDTWQTFDLGATGPVPSTLPHSEARPRGVVATWSAVILGVVLVAAGVGWWRASTRDRPRLDQWAHEPLLPAPDSWRCGPDGRLAWTEDGRGFTGVTSDSDVVEVPGVEAGDQLVWDPSGPLYVARPERDALVLIPAEGGDPRRAPLQGQDATVALAPDAVRVLQYDRDGLSWAEVGGERSTRLVDAQTFGAVWSPDAVRIAALVRDDHALAVWLFDVATGARRQLRAGPGLLGSGHVGVTWLDDGRVAWIETVDGKGGMWAVDPDVDAEPVRLTTILSSVVSLDGQGVALCQSWLTMIPEVQVLDAETFEVLHEREVDEELYVAGWAGPARVQLHDQGERWMLWDLPTHRITEGFALDGVDRPDLGWTPDSLRCVADRCVAVDVRAGERQFTPVDLVTGEPGPIFVATLPASGSGNWDLAVDGRIAMVAGSGVHIVAADGGDARPLGNLGMTVPFDVRWDVRGRLWSVGEGEVASVLVRWSAEDGAQRVQGGRNMFETAIPSPDGSTVAMRVHRIGPSRFSRLHGYNRDDRPLWPIARRSLD